MEQLYEDGISSLTKMSKENLKKYSDEVKDKLEYCQRMLVHLTKKGVALNTREDKNGILLHASLEVSK